MLKEFEDMCEQIGIKEEKMTRSYMVKLLSKCNWDKLEAMDYLLNTQHVKEQSSN